MTAKLIPQEIIQNKIFLLRGQKIMLDKDLAILYGVKPIRLREQVKRNIKRFPYDFMFRLNLKEVHAMVSHFAIPSRQHLDGHLPYAFTERGILMLSSILNSERAVEVNIQIMRTFTKLREMLASHKELRQKIETMEKKYDHQFKIVFQAIKELLEPQLSKPKSPIGFHV
ncbi:MAG TPA: ORF6N domain-containing protein [Candidatus Omnitrophota bacterium]|nr:ORF6N domain-containing protein [Candidatus Omnitrophota bacterium]